MTRIQLGQTGLTIEQNGFGALPVQRISKSEAVGLLQKALAGGIDYFDTARSYTDSEEKLGEAFHDRRGELVLATKTMARDAAGFCEHLDTSLRLLRTDHIDVHQFHNPSFCPRPGGEDGLYDAMLAARAQGKIRFIGITCHRLDVAWEALRSGLYDTLQYPFSYLASDEENHLVAACKASGIGFIAMKALSGGLITNSAAACAWITGHDNVVPIWGIQRENELDEFLAHIQNPPKLDDALLTVIENDRRELGGNFCRGCGYCMPCPQGIIINQCARASQLMRRAPREIIFGEGGRRMMAQAEQCTECGQCAARCPYGLDTPALLKRHYQDYLEVLAGKPL